MAQLNTILFDLDGTLIDTAPDMALSLNILLGEQKREALPYDTIRPVVSNGSQALVALGFADETDEDRLQQLKQRYLEIYQQNLCVDSGLFTGLEEILDLIESQNKKWGVVTNKPGWLTNPLMKCLGLEERASCIVSGDTTANRKPHPEPMYYACRQSQSKPVNCVYIGDARRDIEAGNNAGMQTAVAEYGYIGDWENILDWGADSIVTTPDEVRNYLL